MAWGRSFIYGSSANRPILTVHVKDVTMAAPDIICIRVRDQEIERNGLYISPTPHAGALASFQLIANPTKAGNPVEYAYIGGDKKAWHFTSTVPTAFVDRVAVDNIANYSGSSLGGRTVTAVYRTSKPFDGDFFYTGSEVKQATFEHRIYLQLDGNLPGGAHTIAVTGDPFPSTQFTFSDTNTRSCFIQATQTGHRPSEEVKLAYLSGWVPGYGTHGRVDYDTTYGLVGSNKFHLINEAGSIVFTGDITERATATTTEEVQANFRHPSTTQSWTVTAITKNNPGVVTYSGAGDPANGDLLWSRGIGGMTQLEDAWLEVSNVNTGAKTFEIGATTSRRTFNTVAFNGDTSAFGVYTPGTYLSGFGDKLYQTFLANRAATFVYEMDYSAFTTAGTYRVYVPGLGTSHPIIIHDAVHFQTAKHLMKGYYNQLYGMELQQSVGGWARPANFRNGVNGKVMYETLLPACFDAQSGTTWASAISREIEDSPWGTTNVVDSWEPLSDAGDWDFHWFRHAEIPYFFLDTYEMLPSGVRNLEMGFPKSSETIGSLYDELDDLGDLVHMALWPLEAFRRVQHVDGWVYGGCQHDADGGGIPGGGNYYEPSWNTQQSSYFLAADHVSVFHYAYAAAKMAVVLQDAGKTASAALWETSAIAAFNWADSMYQDYAVNGATGSLLQAHYNTYCGVQDGLYAGNAATFAARMATMQINCQTANSSHGVRLTCLALLWRLTGDKPTYGTEIDAVTIGFLNIAMTACWEYCKNADANATKLAYYKTEARIGGGWDNTYRQTVSTYALHGSGGRPAHSTPSAAMWAFSLGAKGFSNTYLQALQGADDFWNGANPENINTVVGLGYRWGENALMTDKFAMSLRHHQVPGTALYTWSGEANFPRTYTGNFSVGDSPVDFTNRTPVSEAYRKRAVEPYLYTFPCFNQVWENVYCIYNMEYTTQTDIVPRLNVALLRHCWDGNTTTEY